MTVSIGQMENAVISVGASHTCISALGNMLCWGGNYSGQLGAGSRVDFGTSSDHMSTLRPVSFQPTLGKVTFVSAGAISSCAVFETGRIVCFGNNDHGQLGIGNNSWAGCGGSCLSIIQLAGIYFADPTVAATSVSSSEYHNCALFTNKRLRW